MNKKVEEQFIEEFRFFYEWGDVIEKTSNVSLQIQCGSFCFSLKDFKKVFEEIDYDN